MTTYNVALHEGVDYDAFWHEMESRRPPRLKDEFVPTRIVEIVNERPTSLRQCWYDLTEEEANRLQGDPRVYCVEIPPEHRDDIKTYSMASQSISYKQASPDSNNLGNLQLLRLTSKQNNLNTSASPYSGTGTYNYSLDGSGVDVVIMDSGCQVNHPEFTDANGVSRVQQIDWYAASGVPGTMPANFYTDATGHGTACASASAGKLYGFAKNAQIYVLTMYDFNPNGIDTTTLFDVLLGWHNNKPINPVTGYKRPTVLNMSFISSQNFYGVSAALPTAGNYRGTPWTTFTLNYAAGNYAFSRASSLFPVLVNSRKIDVEECISAGICCVSAAGNWGAIMDRIGGPDYNNYLVHSNGSTYYYNRGSGNQAANGVICVGNSKSYPFASITSPTDQIYYNSHCGPLVDIFANGVDIAMATSNTGTYADTSPYTYPNSGFKMIFMTGTSFSSPAVAGIAAQFLQVYPTATPSQIKQKIIESSTPDILFDNPGSLSYGNTNYLFGASNRIAYQPYNTAENFTTLGSPSISNATINL